MCGGRCLVATVLELGGQFLDMENIFPDRLEEDGRMGGFMKTTALEAEDKGTFSVGDLNKVGVCKGETFFFLGQGQESLVSLIPRDVFSLEFRLVLLLL